MKPLSQRKRTLYFIFFTSILIVVSPILVFYSMGYRFDTILGFGQVGGIFVVAPMSDVDFSLNNKMLGRSSFFNRNALFQNITPGEYDFLATKNGYYEWRKKTRIFAENVVELHPFMLLKDPALTLIQAEIPRENMATGTSTTENRKASVNQLHKEVSMLFVTPPAPKATNTKPIRTPGDTKGSSIITSKEKVDIWHDGKNIFAKWNGQIESAPIFFCSEFKCSEKILVHTSSVPITHIDFMPSRNDVILFSSGQGVHAIEIEKALPQNIQPLYTKSGDFRISEDGQIYIRNGKNFYIYEM